MEQRLLNAGAFRISIGFRCILYYSKTRTAMGWYLFRLLEQGFSFLRLASRVYCLLVSNLGVKGVIQWMVLGFR